MQIKWTGMEEFTTMIKDLATKSPAVAKQFTLNLANEARDHAVKNCPKITRYLMKNIHVSDKSRGNHIEVHLHTTNVPYAAAVELGTTEPITIVPNKKKALMFPGLDHPVKRAIIPPRKANPYIRPAVEWTVETKARGAFNAAIRIIRGL